MKYPVSYDVAVKDRLCFKSFWTDHIRRNCDARRSIRGDVPADRPDHSDGRRSQTEADPDRPTRRSAEPRATRSAPTATLRASSGSAVERGGQILGSNH